MDSPFFPNFTHMISKVNGVDLSVHIGGQGEPLLLLHGYPETSAAWSKVAPDFAKKFKCIIPDLRGYGQSSVPETDADHLAFSKREMAQDMIDLMQSLGFERFNVLGHDRGARVSYRMALDHPEHIERIGIIEIVPTADMWAGFTAEMAMKAYHWTFLAQKHPMPENMIAADPIAYLEWTLKSWSKDGTLDNFDAIALESYRKQFLDPQHIHAMCEDYRAGVFVDRKLDELSRSQGQKIQAPLFFAWAEKGFPAQTGNPLGLWEEWANNVQGLAITDCGHFPHEENPTEIINCFMPFFQAR